MANTSTGQTDFTGIVNALQMLAQAIGQNGKALDAIRAALPGSLPAPSPGNALDMVRINSGGTAYEVRTPAQVASDIGVVTPPSPATVAPLVDGTAAVGISLLYARQDHVHPLPTPTGWQTVASYTPSAVASQTILLPSGFRRYRFTTQGMSVSVNGANIAVQFSTDGGSTFINTATSYNETGSLLTGATLASYNQLVSSITLGPGLSNAANTTADGFYELSVGSSNSLAILIGSANGVASSGSPAYFSGSFCGLSGPLVAINAIRVFPSSGTFSGTIILEALV